MTILKFALKKSLQDEYVHPKSCLKNSLQHLLKGRLKTISKPPLSPNDALSWLNWGLKN